MSMIRALPSWTQLAWWSQRRHIESRHLPSPSISLDFAYVRLLDLAIQPWRRTRARSTTVLSIEGPQA